MVNLKVLERECINYNLTDYLHTLSDDELQEAFRLVLCDDILGVREKIFECLIIEMQYRHIPCEQYYNHQDAEPKKR